MALDSSSTRAEAYAQYADNVAYDVENSLAKCRLFVAACRFLLSTQHTVSVAQHGGSQGERVEVDPGVLERQLNAALHWLASAQAAAAGGGAVRHADFTDFRC